MQREFMNKSHANKYKNTHQHTLNSMALQFFILLLYLPCLNHSELNGIRKVDCEMKEYKKKSMKFRL